VNNNLGTYFFIGPLCVPSLANNFLYKDNLHLPTFQFRCSQISRHSDATWRRSAELSTASWGS